MWDIWAGENKIMRDAAINRTRNIKSFVNDLPRPLRFKVRYLPDLQATHIVLPGVLAPFSMCIPGLRLILAPRDGFVFEHEKSHLVNHKPITMLASKFWWPLAWAMELEADQDAAAAGFDPPWWLLAFNPIRGTESHPSGAIRAMCWLVSKLASMLEGITPDEVLDPENAQPQPAALLEPPIIDLVEVSGWYVSADELGSMTAEEVEEFCESFLAASRD